MKVMFHLACIYTLSSYLFYGMSQKCMYIWLAIYGCQKESGLPSALRTLTFCSAWSEVHGLDILRMTVLRG